MLDRQDISRGTSRLAAPAKPREGILADMVGVEEALVADVRARRTPSEEVEERLFGLLGRSFIPTSRLRLSHACQRPRR